MQSFFLDSSFLYKSCKIGHFLYYMPKFSLIPFMDILFLSGFIPYELMFLLLNLTIILAIYLYDGYRFVKRVYFIMRPKRMDPFAHMEVHEADRIEPRPAPVIETPKIVETPKPQEVPVVEMKQEEKVEAIQEEVTTPSIQMEVVSSEATLIETEEPAQMVQDEIHATIQEEAPVQYTEEYTPSQEVPPSVQNEKQQLAELVRAIRTKIALGSLMDAHAMIVEGLSIDKNHLDLNLLLASLFEQDGSYKKAEYIYRDLVELYPNNKDVYNKLGIAVSMQGKYEVALEVYKQLLEFDTEPQNTILMLAHIAHEMRQYDESYHYAKLYLKQQPHNTEMLWILSHACIEQGLRSEALEYLHKLRNFSPRNQEIIDLIEKLHAEEELAKNFKNPA